MIQWTLGNASFVRLATALAVMSLVFSSSCDSDSQPEAGASLAAGRGGDAASGRGGSAAEERGGEDVAGAGGAAANGGRDGRAADTDSAAKGGNAGRGGSAARSGGGDTAKSGSGGAGDAAASGAGAGADADAGGAAGATAGTGASGTAGTDASGTAGTDASGTGNAGAGTGAAGGAANGGSGVSGTGAAAGSAAPPAGELTFLSATDRSPDGITLSADRLSGEWLGLGTYGVRSTRSIAPQQGVFYFEATAALDYFDLGLATASAPLDRPAGATGAGFSVNTQGRYAENQDVNDFAPRGDTYGFVVDYRGAHPVVHVVNGASPGEVVLSEELEAIDQSIFIHLSGQRRMAGMQVTINAGNDTTNRPFALDPSAALAGANLADVASALVLGWGATHAGVPNAAPSLNVAPPSTTSIVLGSSVTLSASANDVEDGSLDARIAWEVLSEGNGPERVRGDGASFTFEPRALGRHPVQVSVEDARGKRAQQTLTIEVSGTLQQFTEVRLMPEPGLSGSGIQLSPDGLRARWTVDQKNGVRANQGLYGGFWYVEGHRLVAESNQAIGLVVGNVSLDPYHFDVTPPSCSVNNVGPGVYQDLILVSQYDTQGVEYYGLAVDYRRTFPIVYVILDGKLTDTLRLTDATVPIYPMLYGNITGLGAPYDMEINFGATKFHEDPIAVLNAAGVATDGLRLCWGDMNQSCNN